jgi:hypothetical protein
VYFGNYGVSRVNLVILEFSGLFWSLWCLRGYFGHISIFGVILVILWVRCYFGHICVSGLFWSLLCFRIILFILEFSRLFLSF